MIFKVQQSITTNRKKQQVLIYNKDKSIMWEGDMPKDVKKALGDRLKAYFYGELIRTKINVNPNYEYEDWNEN
ncbi:MAG: hypothetical protein AABY22_14025 [Nanoarchaeota archaeon]